MLIRHIGHAEFYLETESGVRIVTDPYDASCGFPVKNPVAEIVLVSHGHHDHNAVENVAGEPSVIKEAGVYTPAADVKITAIRSYHDAVQGVQRGETLLFLIETEGLRIVHMGDVGCMPDEDQMRQLQKPDILMIPVGGFFTIDGAAAHKIADWLEAGIILPMHYRTKYNPDWPTTGPEEFLSGYEENEIMRDAEALRVTDGDKACHSRVVLFRQE